MDKIWEFFENLNELVYAVDIDTCELLYMNKLARETYRIGSIAQAAGRKCYEIIQNCGAPCAACNNDELKEGSFIELKYYDPVLQRYFKLKDTLVTAGGRRCRLEIAVDVGMHGRDADTIGSGRNLEALAIEGLHAALQAPTQDKLMETILEYAGKAVKGSRTYIFEKNERGTDDNTYEWTASGVKPEKENLQDLKPQVCSEWYQSFRGNRNLIIENLEDIREKNPLQYQILKRRNTHSLAAVPLYDGREIIGFCGVDDPAGKSLAYACELLQIMGPFITAFLKRRDLVRQLQEMSCRDQLTGMGNRYAMNRYIGSMHLEETVGVVYCDITGLKRVNDMEGHKEGDRLIVRACTCMKKVFDGYGLFRIGGDELLALCRKIDEDALQEKVRELKAELHRSGVVMAVGTVWRKECAQGVEKLLSEAEKLMYQDKAEYYKTSGIDRRR